METYKFTKNKMIHRIASLGSYLSDGKYRVPRNHFSIFGPGSRLVVLSPGPKSWV